MTTITDLIPDGDVARKLDKWVRHYATLKSGIRQAGLVASNADLQARVNAPGNVTTIPFYNPLPGESVPGSDNLNQHIVAGKVTGGEGRAVRIFRNGSWEGASLTAMVTGLNPMVAIREGLTEWLSLDEQRQLVAMIRGVAAHAAANDESEAAMLAGSATAKLDGAMLADACQTKGENKDILNRLVIHSAVHNDLVKANLVQTVADSEQNTTFEVYQGKRLFVTDAMPKIADKVYMSLVCGTGILNLAYGAPERGPIGIQSSETAGNGSGGDQLVHRRVAIQGFGGYSYLGAENSTNAAFATAANYERIVAAEQIPAVFVTSLID